MSTTRTIYFVPRHIVSLKYFEHLFPALEREGWSPALLLLEDLGMIAHCRERELQADTSLVPSFKGVRIPFVSHVRAFNAQRRAACAFLDANPDVRIVFEASLTEPMHMLAFEAHARGVSTLALQWTLATLETDRLPFSLSRKLRKLSAGGRLLYALAKSAYLYLLVRLFHLLDVLGGRHRYVFADVLPERVGVIDSFAREYFLAKGYAEGAIDVVGSYYEEHAHLERKRYDEDRSLRDALQKRLGLQDGPHILVASTIFYSGHSTLWLSREENVRYYEKIFEAIRGVYGKDASILFKLHPREYADAAQYAHAGVRVLTSEADAEELLNIASLYIAHPITNVNRIARAAGVPAIFINFTPLSFMNGLAKYFKITKIVGDWEEFSRMLGEAKRGNKLHTYEPAGDEVLGVSARLAAFLTR